MRLKDIPHKNLLGSATLALMIFLVGFFVIHPPRKTSIVDEQLLSSDITATSSSTFDIDSDGDGLPDWKEKLYGSDIHNTDTDGDGTSDGEEVAEGRDPATPNTAGVGNPPNDKLKYLQDPHFATSSTDVQGIRKEFFAKYLAESSQNIKEQTFKDLMRTVKPERFQAKNELSDLYITSDNSAESVKKYLNSFGVLIKKYTAQPYRNEDAVLNDAMKTKNSEQLKELQLPIIGYQNFSRDLKQLEVPVVLADAHLKIVNGYEGMAKGLSGAQVVFSDPINGTAGLESYSKYKLDVTDGYAMIVIYVAKNNISMNQDEPGILFYWNTKAVSTK